MRAKTFLTPLQKPFSDAATVLQTFALGLGVYSLVTVHLRNIARKRTNWGYSVVLLGAILAMLIPSLLKQEHPNRYNNGVQTLVFTGMYNTLNSTMFSIVAFYIVSAAYRAFRIRSIESTVLLLSAFLIMLGQVAIGAGDDGMDSQHGLCRELPGRKYRQLDFDQSQLPRCPCRGLWTWDWWTGNLPSPVAQFGARVVFRSGAITRCTFPFSALWFVGQKIDRRILYVLLAFVLSTPFLISVPVPKSVVSPQAHSFYDTIEEIANDSVNSKKLVILSTNYEAGTLAENQTQTEAVMRHLMKRHLKFAIFSFAYPQGRELAQKRGNPTGTAVRLSVRA